MTDEERPKFSAFLSTYQRGLLDDNLAAAMADLSNDVQLHQKGGSLTVTIKLAPKADAILVSHDLKVTAPKPKAAESLYFADGRGNLSRRDPKQPQLPGTGEEEEANR